MDTAHANVSVVIPTYNRAEMACACVASVLATGCRRGGRAAAECAIMPA